MSDHTEAEAFWLRYVDELAERGETDRAEAVRLLIEAGIEKLSSKPSDTP